MKRIFLLLMCLVVCALSFDAATQTRRDGEIFFNEKRYKEAYDVYAYLMTQNTRNYTLKYQAARCLYEMGRYDEAMKLLRVAADKGVAKANIYIGEIHFAEYRFEEAAAAFAAYVASLEAGQDSVAAVYNVKVQRANMGASMLERVEDIAIIDSAKVHKSQILSAYRLPRDLGKLELYQPEYGVATEQPQVAYHTGRGDKKVFSNAVEGRHLDLNVAYRLVDGWGEASDMSDVLNTAEDENYPFELPDGVTLYFASKGHNALGGYDIFLTRYNNTIENYSVPVNVGMPFNSPVNDYFYVFDEMAHIGWFATDRYQHPDSVVVYEFLPNREKVLVKTDDVEHRRKLAQMKAYRKANIATGDVEVASDAVTHEKSEFNFLVNDGIVYTRLTQFVSKKAKELYVAMQEMDMHVTDLKNQLEAKRREYFFSTDEEHRGLLRTEILTLEREVRKYKALVEDSIKQIRREEINTLINKE